jgi:peptidoglycan hydrolase CwlO-like protein
MKTVMLFAVNGIEETILDIMLRNAPVVTATLIALVIGSFLIYKTMNIYNRNETQHLLTKASIDRLDDKVNHVEEKVDKLEKKVDKLEVKVDKLEVKVDKLEDKVDKLESKVDRLADKMDQKFDRVFEMLLQNKS